MNQIAFLCVVFLCIAFTQMVQGVTYSNKDCESSEGFKADVNHEFEVRYGMRKRGRKHTPKVTEAEISWDPQEMLDNPRCYSVSEATLHYAKTLVDEVEPSVEELDNLIWETVSFEERKNSGKRMKWSVDVIPCFRYYFKVGVHKVNNEDGDLYESDVKILEPVNKTTILESEYTPQAPVFLQVVPEETSANLEWDASHCVHSYEFSIRKEGDDESGEYRTISTSTKTVKVEQLALKSCTNYEASLQAHLGGDKYSEDTSSKSFSTKPTIDTSDNIKLKDPDYGIDYISFSLKAPWSPGLNCLKQYRIEVCPGVSFGADSTCSNPKETIKKEITANNPTLETRIENLEPCTTYQLMITPIFDTIDINTMTYQFKTLPPGGIIDTYEPKAPTKMQTFYTENGDVKVEWDESECVEEYKIRYGMLPINQYDAEEYSEGEEYNALQDCPDCEGSGSEVTKTATTNSITLSTMEPCAKYFIELNTHYNGKESNYLDHEFVVRPNVDSGKHILELIEVDVQDNAFSMSLDTLQASLQCITQYNLTLCKNNGKDEGFYDEPIDCVTTNSIVFDPQTEKYLSTDFDNIEYCTSYALEIQPMHSEVLVDPVRYEFKSSTIDASLVSIRGVEAENFNNGTTLVTWDAIKCAASYLVNEADTQNTMKTVTENQLQIDDTPSCSVQSFEIYAVLEDGSPTIADDGSITSIITKWNPEELYNPDNLMKNPTETSISLSWQGLPCISIYEVEICQLNDLTKINCLNHTVSSMYPESEEFQASDLMSCTEYSLRIIPNFSGIEINVQRYTFKTLTPNGQSLSVTGLQASSYHNGTTILSWEGVQCATSYEISRNGEKMFSDLSETQLVVDNSDSCSVQDYVILAILDSGEQTKVTEDSSISIITKWNKDNSYSPPGLNVIPSSTIVDVTWNSLPCIDEYSVVICPTQDEENEICTPQVKEQNQEGTMEYRNTDVKQCTEYSLTIRPIFKAVNDILHAVNHTPLNIEGSVKIFTTPTDSLNPPENVIVVFVPEEETIKLTWDKVDCATSYVIDQYIDGKEARKMETTDLGMTVDDIISCSTYSYIITAVSGKKSSSSKEVKVEVPPNSKTLPDWTITQNEKRGAIDITIDIMVPNVNRKCKTQGFKVTHNATGTTSTLTFEEGSGINIDLAPSGFQDLIKISGGILYERETMDGLDPKYITQIEQLTTSTTTTTTTTTTRPPPTTMQHYKRSPRMNKSSNLRPTYYLISLTCMIMVLQYPYGFF